jgi:SMODS and SLOG-associating 2TM effector domain 1/SLOG in TRPM, prokaryote/Protein of unknown function (DUF4231)
MTQKIVDIDPSKPVVTAAEEFRPATRSLIILLGAFDPGLNDRTRSVFSRVVAPVAVESGALILDDARSSGCAPLMAQATLDQDTVPTLIGIIANDRTANDIDPNHELVLRLPAVWSGQAKYWFQLAAGLAPEAASSTRVAALLFGGGAAEQKAVLWCARRGWPVLVVGKTGGLADQIISTSTSPEGVSSPAIDPDLREILETAALFPSAMDAGMDDLRRILTGRLTSSPETLAETLKEAWLRYDEIDRSAIAKQTRFRRLQLALIILAVLATLFAILQSGQLPASFMAFVHRWYVPSGTLHILVIVTPIALSILAAYNSHFRDGSKWILLRGAAEALKREIFRFRAQAGGYSDEQCVQTSRESKLIARIGDIASALEQSEVNKTNLESGPPGDELRQTTLTPNQYVHTRIEDQINYFKVKTRKLATQLTAMQVLILITGGAGTFLAAIHLDVWVALATAVVTALTAKIQTDQAETSLIQYNQALASLKNIEAWWKALSSWEKGRRQNVDLLVDQTEKTLEGETAGWVQQMQSALDKLTEKEPQANSK